jgi:hypothetical protein
MERTNHEQMLDKFLIKLKEVAKADHAELLSRRMIKNIAATKCLNRDLKASNISYNIELLQLSVRYKKDYKQLLDDVLNDVWIKESLRQLTSKLRDEAIKRQLGEQLDSDCTNFLFVTAELGKRPE